MTTKKEREEARELLGAAIKAATRKRGGETILIVAHEHKPSSSGVTYYFDILTMGKGPDGNPVQNGWLSFLYCKAFGHTFNKKRDCVSMGGYGYCRATHAAHDLARLAGKPIHVQSTGFFAGPNGWVKA